MMSWTRVMLSVLAAGWVASGVAAQETAVPVDPYKACLEEAKGDRAAIARCDAQFGLLSRSADESTVGSAGAPPPPQPCRAYPAACARAARTPRAGPVRAWCDTSPSTCRHPQMPAAFRATACPARARRSGSARWRAIPTVPSRPLRSWGLARSDSWRDIRGCC